MSEESIEFILKAFSGTRYFPRFKLTTWHPTGVFDQPFADKLIEFLEWEEYIQEAPWDRYADLSGVTAIQITLDYIIYLARRRKFVREPVKSALFADRPDGLALVQSYERLMEGAAMIKVRSFDNREAAAEWLDVPPSVLMPPPAV
jgi:hypothetical protein